MQAKASRLKQKFPGDYVEWFTQTVNPIGEVLSVQADAQLPLSSRITESVAHPSLFRSNPVAFEAQLDRQMTQILTVVSPEDQLLEIAQALGRAYDAQACLIASYGSAPTAAPITAWFAESSATTLHPEDLLACYPTIATMALNQGGAVILADTGLNEVLDPPSAFSFGSLICVVAQTQETPIGTICLIRTQAFRCGHPETQALLNLSHLVAFALAHQGLQQRMQKQAQYQTLLRELSGSIQNFAELPQVLPWTIAQIAQVLGLDRTVLFRIKFWDPRQSLRASSQVPKARITPDYAWSQTLSQTLCAPPSPDQGAKLSDRESHPDIPALAPFWLSECALCQAMISSEVKSLRFFDSLDFPEETATVKIGAPFDPQKMPALLLIPLESKSRLLGFVALQQRVRRVWQPEEIELAELVGAQISAAIIQTETLRQVEMLVEERTAQLQQSLELQAKLYDVTRKQMERLREMNQRMDEFLSTLSHELRTPLTSMMLAIRMLQQGTLAPDRQRQYLTILEQQCLQETNLVNDLLALQELEMKQVNFQFQAVDLQEIITDVAQVFEQRWSAKGLQLEVQLPDPVPTLDTDVTSLHRILLELLTNAGKYSNPNSQVMLTLLQCADQVQIKLHNIGSGILPEELPHIFEKFRRCQGMTQNAVPGTGLGLALVKSLVQHLNGTIGVSSVAVDELQSYETCFTVTLPQNLVLHQL